MPARRRRAAQRIFCGAQYAAAREQLLASVELGPVFKLRSSLLTAVYASLLRADGCLEELRGVQLELGGFGRSKYAVAAQRFRKAPAQRESNVRDT